MGLWGKEGNWLQTSCVSGAFALLVLSPHALEQEESMRFDCTVLGKGVQDILTKGALNVEVGWHS